MVTKAVHPLVVWIASALIAVFLVVLYTLNRDMGFVRLLWNCAICYGILLLFTQRKETFLVDNDHVVITRGPRYRKSFSLSSVREFQALPCRPKRVSTLWVFVFCAEGDDYTVCKSIDKESMESIQAVIDGCFPRIKEPLVPPHPDIEITGHRKLRSRGVKAGVRYWVPYRINRLFYLLLCVILLQASTLLLPHDTIALAEVIRNLCVVLYIFVFPALGTRNITIKPSSVGIGTTAIPSLREVAYSDIDDVKVANWSLSPVNNPQCGIEVTIKGTKELWFPELSRQESMSLAHLICTTLHISHNPSKLTPGDDNNASPKGAVQHPDRDQKTRTAIPKLSRRVNIDHTGDGLSITTQVELCWFFRCVGGVVCVLAMIFYNAYHTPGEYASIIILGSSFFLAAYLWAASLRTERWKISSSSVIMTRWPFYRKELSLGDVKGLQAAQKPLEDWALVFSAGGDDFSVCRNLDKHSIDLILSAVVQLFPAVTQKLTIAHMELERPGKRRSVLGTTAEGMIYRLPPTKATVWQAIGIVIVTLVFAAFMIHGCFSPDRPRYETDSAADDAAMISMIFICLAVPLISVAYMMRCPYIKIYPSKLISYGGLFTERLEHLFSGIKEIRAAESKLKLGYMPTCSIELVESDGTKALFEGISRLEAIVLTEELRMVVGLPPTQTAATAGHSTPPSAS